jgi:hypothetical protein
MNRRREETEKRLKIEFGKYTHRERERERQEEREYSERVCAYRKRERWGETEREYRRHSSPFISSLLSSLSSLKVTLYAITLHTHTRSLSVLSLFLCVSAFSHTPPPPFSPFAPLLHSRAGIEETYAKSMAKLHAKAQTVGSNCHG